MKDGDDLTANQYDGGCNSSITKGKDSAKLPHPVSSLFHKGENIMNKIVNAAVHFLPWDNLFLNGYNKL